MTIFLINTRKGFSMDNQKHRKFVEEMMVTFGGNQSEGNNAPEPGTEGPPEPEYNAIDVFTNAANDMLKDFMPASTNDTVGAPTHIMVTDTMTDERPFDQTPETTDVTDTSIDPSADQIVFDMVDGTLCIKFADTELHLGPDAVSKLQDYLADQPEESDDESESDESDDSEESEENDEKVEESFISKDSNSKLRFEDPNPKFKKCKCGRTMTYDSHNKQYKCPYCHAWEQA